jgi:hypothetical protein
MWNGDRYGTSVADSLYAFDGHNNGYSYYILLATVPVDPGRASVSLLPVSLLDKNNRVHEQ